MNVNSRGMPFLHPPNSLMINTNYVQLKD